MDKIDTEIRFAGMAEERLRREDPHYRVWSFTDDDDVTALYLGRVDMNGEPVERDDRTRTILAFDGGRVFAKWHGGRLFEGGRLAKAWFDEHRDDEGAIVFEGSEEIADEELYVNDRNDEHCGLSLSGSASERL